MKKTFISEAVQQEIIDAAARLKVNLNLNFPVTEMAPRNEQFDGDAIWSMLDLDSDKGGFQRGESIGLTGWKMKGNFTANLSGLGILPRQQGKSIQELELLATSLVPGYPVVKEQEEALTGELLSKKPACAFDADWWKEQGCKDRGIVIDSCPKDYFYGEWPISLKDEKETHRNIRPSNAIHTFKVHRETYDLIPVMSSVGNPDFFQDDWQVVCRDTGEKWSESDIMAEFYARKHTSLGQIVHAIITSGWQLRHHEWKQKN